jgi:integrase
MGEKRTYNKKGNPFQRGKTWTFIYYAYDENGKRVQKWKGGYATKREAEQALKEINSKIALGMVVSDSSMTVEAYMTKWIAHRQKFLEPNTYNGYLNNINNHIIPAIGKVRLRDLTTTMVEDMCIDLFDNKHLKQRTVEYVYTVLTAALNRAVLDKKIERNPCIGAELPKDDEDNEFEATDLTVEQIKELICAIIGSKYEFEIMLAIKLGLRRGETLGLRFSDYDPVHNLIYIRKQVSVVKRKDDDNTVPYYGVKSVKTKKSKRKLHVSKDIVEMIEQKRAIVQQQKAVFGEDYHDNDLICCKPNGDPISPQTLYHAFKRILEKSNLPDVRFHDLRHSYATLLTDLNIPVKAISMQLGHSSIVVTDSVYAKSITAVDGLIDKVNEALDEDDE